MAKASNKTDLLVWLALLALTIAELAISYRPSSWNALLLIAIAVVQAGLIIAYSMHLKYERASLGLALVSILVIWISLFMLFFPDSLRLLKLGTN